MLRSVCPSICLSHAHSSTAVHFKTVVTAEHYSVLEVEPTCQRGRTATSGGRNGNEAVALATSEAFDGWHHRYAPVELSLAGHIVPCT